VLCCDSFSTAARQVFEGEPLIVNPPVYVGGEWAVMHYTESSKGDISGRKPVGRARDRRSNY